MTELRLRDVFCVQAVALLILLSACGPILAPAPPSQPRILHANVSIRTQTGQPIDSAAGTLTVDPVEGPGAVVTASGWRQSYTLPEGPTARPGWGATLTIGALGYVSQTSRIVVPDGDEELPEVVLAPSVPPVQRLSVAGRWWQTRPPTRA